MKRSMIVEQISKHFRYLFNDYGFNVISETHFESFGNWVVVLASDDFRIRLFEDRGEVTISVGPLWSPPGWQAGPWYDLTFTIEFLTQGKDLFEYEGGKTEQQLERLAGVLRAYCDQIHELFQEEVFRQKQEELELLVEQRLDQFWNQLTRKTEITN